MRRRDGGGGAWRGRLGVKIINTHMYIHKFMMQLLFYRHRCNRLSAVLSVMLLMEIKYKFNILAEADLNCSLTPDGHIS